MGFWETEVGGAVEADVVWGLRRWEGMSECVALGCFVAEKGSTIMRHGRSNWLHETIYRSRLTMIMRMIGQGMWHGKFKVCI